MDNIKELENLSKEDIERILEEAFKDQIGILKNSLNTNSKIFDNSVSKLTTYGF